MNIWEQKRKKIIILIASILILNLLLPQLNTYALETSPQIDTIDFDFSTNSIYISFSEEINLNSDRFTNLIEGITLYKLPGTSEENKISYVLSEGSYKAEVGREEIEISNAKISDDNQTILQIDPAITLLYANRYQVIIDKDLLKDNEGNILTDHINQLTWTEKSAIENTPEWVKVEVGEKKVQEAASYSDTEITFNIDEIEAPSETNPIIIYSDSELIPATVSQKVYKDDVNDFRLFEQSLENISLKNNIDGTNVKISQVVFEYYDEDNVKKTKLYIYPYTTLLYGEEYALSIPLNVVETRGEKSPKTINVNLSIKYNADYESFIESTYPMMDDTAWYDETELKHDKSDDFVEDYYFIKITFENDELEIDYSDLSLIKTIQVYPEGTESNFLDTSFISNIENATDKNDKIDNFLFVKDTANKTATLYIPIEPLLSGIKYNVSLPPGIFFFPGDYDGNGTITWSFTTSTEPIISDIIIATVPEGYDEDEPIYIEGDLFYETNIEDNNSVYIGGERVEDVKVMEKTVLEDGEDVTKEYLEIYLPDGSDRLKPGIYSIEVRNDENHITEVLGALSVVETGDYIPNEEYRVKNDEGKGEVHGDIKRSEDTLILDSRYADDSYVKLDLDQWMGEDVWTRKIEYEGDKSDVLGVLETKSIWADISLYKLTLDDGAEDDNITINLGRIEPSLKQYLKRKMWGKAIKSDFIEVTGENFTMTGAVLSIPFENSNGKSLKALRYDENTRNFYEVKSSVNLVDKRVEIESTEKGIFVIVED